MHTVSICNVVYSKLIDPHTLLQLIDPHTPHTLINRSTYSTSAVNVKAFVVLMTIFIGL